MVLWGPVEDDCYIDPYVELAGYAERQFKKWHRKFVWTDKKGVDHKIRDIDDVYLRNIIGFLERVTLLGTYCNVGVLQFLRDEQESRKEVW